MLGITGVAKRKAMKSKTEAAERATRWLWIKRADLWAVAAGKQARGLSSLPGSPGLGGLILKDLKPMTQRNITEDASQHAEYVM